MSRTKCTGILRAAITVFIADIWFWYVGRVSNTRGYTNYWITGNQVEDGKIEGNGHGQPRLSPPHPTYGEPPCVPAGPAV
jgi:hypothetical protein